MAHQGKLNCACNLRSNSFGWFLQDLFNKKEKPKRINVINVDHIEIHEPVSFEILKSPEIFHDSIDSLVPSKEKLCELIDPNTLEGRILLQIISPARHAQLIASNRNKYPLDNKQVDNRNNVSLMDELISVGAACIYKENKSGEFVEKPEVDSAYVSDFDCESDSEEVKNGENLNFGSLPTSGAIVNIKENLRVSCLMFLSW